jgi:hypothetical protein
VGFIAIVLFGQIGSVIASSFSPTVLVSTEALIIIDDRSSTDNVVLKFGDTLAKTLTYNRTTTRFEFNDNMYITGTLGVSGTASGKNLFATESITGAYIKATSTFYGAGLSAACNNATNDKLLWANGAFTCGADQGGGGISQTDADNRYVNTNGDTMTGNLIIKNGALLNVSGAILTNSNITINSDNGAANAVLTFGNATASQTITFNHTTQRFEISKDVRVTGGVTAVGALSGTTLMVSGITGNTFILDGNSVVFDATNNRFGIAVGSTPETTLEVGGTASGRIVRAQDTLASSGSLVVRKPAGTSTGTFLTVDARGLVYDATNKRVGIGTASPDTTLEVVGTASGRLIRAQDRLESSGSLVVENGSYLSGAIRLYEGTNPATPANNSLALHANSDEFDREMLRVTDADGVSYYLQPAAFGNFVAHVSPGSTATTLNSFGEGVTASATLSQPTPTEAMPFATNFATSTTSGNESGFIGFSAPYFRGSAVGGNGFFFSARVMSGSTANARLFLGVTEQTSLINAMASDNIANDDSVQFQFSTVRGDTNWQFATKDGTTQNLTNTGLAMSYSKVYEMYFYCKPQCTTIYWKIINKTDNTSAQGSTSTNLPTTTQAMRKFIGVETQTTQAKQLRMQYMYTEFKGAAN